MLNKTLPATIHVALHDLPEPVLHKIYFFHDIQITCHTNHPAVFALLDEMLGVFSAPQPQQLQGVVSYTIACYQEHSQFPVQLPPACIHTETIRLVTGTKLRYYSSNDDATEYHAYAELPSVNAPVLSVVSPSKHSALTQLEAPDKYLPLFLRRCVFLMVLGQLMRPFQFEPCHAAAVSAPWDEQQGALIFGSSGSGKTTLSLGCTIAGYGFLGDDLLMLREGSPGDPINAYAFIPEVSVRAGTLDLWSALAFLQDLPADSRGKRHCLIEQIRPGAFRRQAPIRLLLFPVLIEDSSSSSTPLSKARTLQELIDQCMHVEKTYPRSQERLFLLLSKLAEQAPGYRLSVARHAHDVPQLLRTLFAGGASQ